MNKYFKLDKDKREIIIDKTKKYNVNVDILDLIIDLQLENKQLKSILTELEEWIEYMLGKFGFKLNGGMILGKLQELKEKYK